MLHSNILHLLRRLRTASLSVNISHQGRYKPLKHHLISVVRLHFNEIFINDQHDLLLPLK